jgi:Zn-dependent M28 family amino/carboxypeptidase
LRLSFAVALISILSFPIAALPPRQETNPLLSSEDQIREEFAQVPCKNKERLNAVRKVFEKMGATPDEFSIDKVKNAENLVVTRKGSEPGKIVIGAHYDFADLGCGAVDNWTGIIAMAHTYKSVRLLGSKKTVIFVAFGNEEEGLFGSQGMVRAIPNLEVPEYCAMINIDSFGMALPFVLKNVSSEKLTALVEERAAGLKLSFNKVSIPLASTDSASFIDRKIPAVTLSGLSNQWESVLHTSRDQVRAVNHASVYLGYRLALATWAGADQASCDAFKDSVPSLKQK